jgi:hypothetical protein
MDKSKPSGISIKDVKLVDCTLGGWDPNAELRYFLGIVQKVRQVSDDGRSLFYMFSFDLMKGIKTPSFKFTCSFLAEYSRSDDANMTWEEFTDAHALTHIIPFVREFVVNLTTRMVVPRLTIPPINAYALLADYEKEQTQGSPKKTIPKAVDPSKA